MTIDLCLKILLFRLDMSYFLWVLKYILVKKHSLHLLLLYGQRIKVDGAVMITASHNPYKYNGIKFIPNYGGPASDEITEKLKKN
jgi:phosphomannomutase